MDNFLNPGKVPDDGIVYISLVAEHPYCGPFTAGNRFRPVPHILYSLDHILDLGLRGDVTHDDQHRSLPVLCLG